MKLDRKNWRLFTSQRKGEVNQDFVAQGCEKSYEA
jgi:hypothetical protein